MYEQESTNKVAAKTKHNTKQHPKDLIKKNAW